MSKKTDGQKNAEAELKKDPNKAHIRASLRKSFPFLVHNFRTLKTDEIKSEKVFKELFSKEKFASHKLYRLAAIYEYQN